MAVQLKSTSLSTFKTFVYALAIVGSVKNIRLLPRSSRRRKSSPGLLDVAANYTDPSSIKTALFPALLPPVYASLRSKNAQVAEVLSSPLLMLLPHGIRLEVAMYLVTSALQARVRRSPLNKHLPPIWWFNTVANTLLLWSFLRHRKSFPRTYESLLLRHPSYAPSYMSNEQLHAFLSRDTWLPLSPQNQPEHGYEKGHKYLYCATLHPTDPNCLRVYLKAWLTESLKAAKWVGGFNALTIVLTRRKDLTKNPTKVFKSWFTSTLRNTAFVVGSINSAWGGCCLIQRLVGPQGYLGIDVSAVNQLLFSGSIASFWILALLPQRRGEISLYVSRLSILCLWDVWRRSGGIHLKYGEILLAAGAWAQLASMRKQGARVPGFVGMGLNLIDKA
ncbi:hypothetical protein SISNIDRAFT_481182 [Sistotremastrum niveocremeum HHB9708]|uniref:Transmembrane protein 135 N-terminal domain-containing protein n=1 Tax=Sistotremastrum niveocremeum HHB9708 TaxID=1314777 RepID=A0A165A3P0_9AGAM|nr:hypothetical protein SISNIDRAFT_481182 [Sistotremastrum niveocremeum HHB9708]